MMVPYRRGGFRGMGDSNINPTTIWTPQTGFLSIPGDPTSGMYRVISNDPIAGPAVYRAPDLVPVPACASGPAGTADSAECIAQVLAAQQLRMKLANQANYAVDLENCLNTFPQPTNCYERTFGLTLPGTTGGADPAVLLPDASTLLGTGQQPSINMIECLPGYHPNPTRTGCDMDAAPVPAVTPPAKPVVPAVGGGGYVSEATDFLTQQVPISGSSFPVWELAGAGLLALLLLKGGH